MVLMLIDTLDISTNDIIKWLDYFEAEYIVISESDIITNIECDYSSNIFYLSINGEKQKIYLDEIKSVFFRRGKLRVLFPDLNKFSDLEIKRGIAMHLSSEWQTLEALIIQKLESKKRFGCYYDNEKKLLTLQLAKEIGIKIPETYICSKKTILQKTFNSQKNLITKGLQNGLTITSKTNDGSAYSYYNLTSKILEDDINEINTTFFPSLIQQKIDKLFELRIFYFSGTFYSMAIFSQKDLTTNVDFRNYNVEKPNRNIPFILPTDIQNKLQLLLDKLLLNTASIDMIYTPEKEYVFLEVNPEGQFGMVSSPCNYHIERLISEYLIN